MIAELFEPFREWVPKTRRRKGSKKLPRVFNLGGARIRLAGGHWPAGAPGEIKSGLEPEIAEFVVEQRSPGASWLNIKQLTEPQPKGGELTSTRQI
jgi:hypothetical protein